jgi:TonB family protein
MTILILAFTTICYGQTSQTKYFNNEWLGKEVSQAKAKYSQTIIHNEDGTVTTELKEIKKDEIVNSETFKGDEPYGIWKLRNGEDYKTIDYNFPVIYSTAKCNDSLPIFTSDYFQDNDSLVYKAPKISTGELTIYQFIGKNIIFPPRAKDEGIQGTVYIQLTLTKEGTFENIVVKRGTNIFLDKEAVRVLRQLKFSSPATINGQPYNFKCLTLPIKFKLM